MSDGSPPSPVAEVLAESQRLGFLGPRPITEVIAHALVFAGAVDSAVQGIPAPSIADIGSGGGVPGLVIAEALPHAHLTLIDRRAKRTDFLDRVVRRLGWTDRVEVWCADVGSVGQDAAGAFDVVVARGFGPPDLTLRLARPLIHDGGAIIVSEPPSGDRWDADLIDALTLRKSEMHDRDGRVAVFRPRP